MILPAPLGSDGSTVPASFAIPSRTDTVVDSIKRMITTGALKAGSRLPIEKDLALELGVSRSSLREGVRALCSMGVLETRQGDGTYVTSLDLNRLLAPMGFLVDLQELSDMSHVQAVRRVLETEAAGRAAIAISDTTTTANPPGRIGCPVRSSPRPSLNAAPPISSRRRR